MKTSTPQSFFKHSISACIGPAVVPDDMKIHINLTFNSFDDFACLRSKDKKTPSCRYRLCRIKPYN